MMCSKTLDWSWRPRSHYEALARSIDLHAQSYFPDPRPELFFYDELALLSHDNQEIMPSTPG
jgi:hypothetical protein